jgi:hypothetical protein
MKQWIFFGSLSVASAKAVQDIHAVSENARIKGSSSAPSTTGMRSFPASCGESLSIAMMTVS